MADDARTDPSRYAALLLATGAGALGGLLVVLAARWSTPTPAFAAVDLQVVLTRRLAVAGPQQLDAAAAQQDARRYAQALEIALDALAAEHGAIILSTPAVVRGVPDRTDELQHRIDAQLASGARP